MNINETQRKILLAFAAVIVLMVAFPPYEVVNAHGFKTQAGYGFLFDLPKYGALDRGYVHARVDIQTLLVQIIGVVVVGGLAFLAYKK